MYLCLGILALHPSLLFHSTRLLCFDYPRSPKIDWILLSRSSVLCSTLGNLSRKSLFVLEADKVRGHWCDRTVWPQACRTRWILRFDTSKHAYTTFLIQNIDDLMRYTALPLVGTLSTFYSSSPIQLKSNIDVVIAKWHCYDTDTHRLLRRCNDRKSHGCYPWTAFPSM